MTFQTRVKSPKYIKNSHDSTQGRQATQLKKWAKNVNRHFSNMNTQRAQKNMKGCLVSLVIREMKMKTSVRYHFTWVRMAIVNKSTNKKSY